MTQQGCDCIFCFYHQLQHHQLQVVVLAQQENLPLANWARDYWFAN